MDSGRDTEGRDTEGRDTGIAAGGAPRHADDAQVDPGPAPQRGRTLPSSLLPLLLFLGACGVRAEKAGPLTRRDDDDAGPQPQDTVALPSADADLTPQARANLINMCLKAVVENTLQQSAIDTLCTLAGLEPGNRDLNDSANDVTWRTKRTRVDPAVPQADPQPPAPRSRAATSTPAPPAAAAARMHAVG
jgi:hypothetical protein